MGMEVALNNQKGKDGKSNAAQPGQNAKAGQKGRPKMIAQHEDHGQDMQEEGRDSFA